MRFLRRPKTTVERREDSAAKADGSVRLRKRYRPHSYDDLNIAALCENRDRAKAKAKAKKSRRK